MSCAVVDDVDVLARIGEFRLVDGTSAVADMGQCNGLRCVPHFLSQRSSLQIVMGTIDTGRRRYRA